MLRLAALFARLEGIGWFAPSLRNMPMPVEWQGWLLYALFLFIITASIWLPIDMGWLLRILSVLGFFGLAFWTMRRER